MNKIITIQQAIKLSKKLKDNQQKVVLVGGCFDLLHIGHIELLENAKEKGDILFVMLESDAKIRQTKGVDRPIHSQKLRAQMLSALSFIDYVLLLPNMTTNEKYDGVVKSLQPAIIATTKGDPMLVHKKRQAKLTNSKIVFANTPIKSVSTSVILSKLLQENV